jgi:phosphoribosylpyrophosphate synthetase
MLRLDGESKKVIYTAQSRKFGSTNDEIDTYIGNGWYSENAADTGNIPIFSNYLYKSSPTCTGILKSLKDEGPYNIDEKTVAKFLRDTAQRSAVLIKTRKIDTLIFPKSSSGFLLAFVEYIKYELGNYPINVIADSIIKKQIDDIAFQSGDIDGLINFEHPSFHTLQVSTIKALKKQIVRNVKMNSEAGNGKVVSIKDLHKMHTKFVFNFLELVEGLSEDLHNKNVLIVDDILSSGSTFAEMVRNVKNEKIKSVMGLTIFKSTTDSKKKI